MPIHPRIEEPSKPRPSLNVSSFHKSIGNEQCCQVPSMSTNFRSTISAERFLAKSKNSDGFIASHGPTQKGAMMGSAVLGEAIHGIRDFSMTQPEKRDKEPRVAEEFGSLVFNDAEQEARLPKPVYHGLRRTITHGESLDAS